MEYSIVWIPAIYEEMVGKEVDPTGDIFLPLFVIHNGPTFSRLEQIFCGVLLVDDKDPFPGSPCTPPSDSQYRDILKLAADKFQGGSVEGWTIHFAEQLKMYFGNGTSIKALRRAAVLLPESFFCLHTLINYLWFEAEAEPDEADDLCGEIAEHFKKLGRIKAQCPDEILYLVFASLVYLGKETEYAEAKLKYSERIQEFNWLAGRVKFLDSMQRGNFSSFANGRWSWILDSPPKSVEELQSVLDMVKHFKSHATPGIITSTLLVSWGKLEKPLKGDSNWYKGCGDWAQDQTFLRRVIGSGKRRNEVFEHLFHFSVRDWEVCFAKILSQADQAKTRKAQLAGAGMPAMGKQIIGQICDFSMKLAGAAEEVDRRMRSLSPIDHKDFEAKLEELARQSQPARPQL